MGKASIKTIRLKVKHESCQWLCRAAREVNAVWNWANETSEKAIRRYVGPAKWLSAFDLTYLSAGATAYFDEIGADTIQRVCCEYAKKRISAKASKLAWRKSGGSRRSLGWIPFRSIGFKRKGRALRFAGKTFRVFGIEALDGHKFRDGCFSQDACGDWWLCIPVAIETETTPAPREAIGIDLGLKTIATTSDGDTLEAGRWARNGADRLAMAQRRGHKRQAKRIHRKIARQRSDALHKFSRKIVNQYQTIIVGDVSSSRLKKTPMAKSVSDSGWHMLKTMLLYKGEHAGRSVQVVDESYTSRACSNCGCLSGPKGLYMLSVRQWTCADCGESHDRDVNAARNILSRARVLASVSGNEQLIARIPAQPVRMIGLRVTCALRPASA